MTMTIVEALLNMFGRRHFENESKERPDVFRQGRFPRLVWPKAPRYRVVQREGYVPGLQAWYHEAWVTVQYYESGWDEYGQLYPGKWQNLQTACQWRVDELEDLARRMANLPPPEPTVVSEIGV